MIGGCVILIVMDRKQLSDFGYALALEVDRLSEDYHVKSDQYEILLWEADILRAKSEDLLRNRGLSDNLKKSALFNASGVFFQNSVKPVAEKLKTFHQQYEALNA